MKDRPFSYFLFAFPEALGKRSSNIRTHEYAEKPAVWPKLLLVAFVLWFVWAFLNDSEARLNGWTDGKYGSQPSKEVVEKRAAIADAKAKTDKAAADAAAGITPAAPAVPVTPAAPAAPVVPAK